MDADETLMPDKDEAGDDDRSVNEIEEGDEAADEDQVDEDEVAEQILDVEGVHTTPTRHSNKAKSAKASATKTPKTKGTAKAAKTPGTVKRKKPRKSEQLNLNALSQEQLVVAEMEGSKIQQLKLQRKYYADALELIRWLDGAASSLCNLLASTSKSEVLEAMEYFRVASEYHLDTAPVRYSRFPFSHYQTNLVFPRPESRRWSISSGQRTTHLPERTERSSRVSEPSSSSAIGVSISSLCRISNRRCK